MLKDRIIDYSKGDDLRRFWRLFRLRERVKLNLVRSLVTFLINRSAHRHGGYVGNGARFEGKPSLPHGLHGVYISRYASIGGGCRIYQNVTIGEVNGKAPHIGYNCFIGAGAILVGNIKIGDYVKIGAGAVVRTDVLDHCTVVAEPPRVIEHVIENEAHHVEAKY